MQKVIHIVDIQHDLLRKLRSKTLRTSKHEMKYALDKYISYHEHLSEHFSYQTDLKHTFYFFVFFVIHSSVVFFFKFQLCSFPIVLLIVAGMAKTIKNVKPADIFKGIVNCIY